MSHADRSQQHQIVSHFDKQFFAGIRKYRTELVKQIVEKTSLLIEDGSIRKKIGREARNLVENGTFSINSRNEQLKIIFEQSLK